MPPGRLLCLFTALAAAGPAAAQPNKPEPADYLLADEAKMTPFKDRVPIVFVTRNQPAWPALPGFWNDATEEAVDPAPARRSPAGP